MEYAHLLLFLLPSMGQILAENGMSSENIVHRKLFVLPQIEHEASNNLVDYVSSHIEDFNHLVDASDIVIPGMKHVEINNS